MAREEEATLAETATTTVKEAAGTTAAKAATAKAAANKTEKTKQTGATNLARGFALFMNWFDGVCAVLFGGFMALSAVVALPVSWDDLMPIELLGSFPFHDIFFTSFLWPGIALMLVNGLPNIIALVQRFRRNRRASYQWGIAAGALLIVWTVIEMIYVPNGISIFYMVLGVLQLAASFWALHTWKQAA